MQTRTGKVLFGIIGGGLVCLFACWLSRPALKLYKPNYFVQEKVRMKKSCNDRIEAANYGEQMLKYFPKYSQ